MGNKHMEERAERLAQLEQFRMVENDFVMVDPDAEDRRIEIAKNRASRLNRQIEEGVYNIKPEDYNEEGELKEEAVVLEEVEDQFMLIEEMRMGRGRGNGEA